MQGQHFYFQNASTRYTITFPITAPTDVSASRACRFLAEGYPPCKKPLILLDRYQTFCYTTSMTKMGRPKMAAKERSSHLIALRLTPDEHKALEQAAEKSKQSISDYIRFKLSLRGEQ